MAKQSPSYHFAPSDTVSAAGKHSQPYPWEQRKLGEITRRYDNLRVPVTASKRKHGDIPYYGANGIQDFVSGYTHDGEFILVAEDGARDPKNYPVNYVNGKIWVNNHAHVLQGIQGLANNLFLLNGIKKLNIAAYLVGGSRAKLNAETLMQLSIKLPSIHEQEKIGQLFQSLDKTITLHEEKQRQLEQLKKALLQKMFADKTGYSALRFKGFSNAWEQRKLGEILSDLYNGQTPSRNVKKYWKGDIPWLTSGELNHGIVMKTIEKISESGKKAANLKLIPKGTIVIAITGLEAPGTRGNCAILGIDTTLNQSVMALFVKTNIDTQFIFQWYKKIGQEYGIRYTQGTKQQSYNYDLVKILPISVPTSTKEQKQIGQFLKQFDSLIDFHQHKIDNLKRLKRALLQKMFV
ncbi:restriction endonuclease subunit S [Limosilactobacillus allomucosae]|uniref:restriction endonuclease subunit S n=1 Tax=Limosilactobacillus allomucosae TaxID=3142938 RepID=UPI0032649A4F